MEPLSSFAISLAAGIALDIYNNSQRTVVKEIKKAFELALKKCYINKSIRAIKKDELKKVLSDLIEAPGEIIDLRVQDPEINEFYEVFEVALAQYQIAYNYIKNIKDSGQFKVEIGLLSSIKSTVEETNNKLDTLIESLPKFDSRLEKEWKRQIAVYKENLRNFKPKTAYDLLLTLKESFESSDLKPDKGLDASIEFLKAQCNQMLGKADEMYICYIRAYSLEPDSITFKEKACYSYAKINETEKSLKLVKELLDYDEYNSMAWVSKVIISESRDLDYLLNSVPNIAKKTLDFRRLVFFNTYLIPEYTNVFEIYEKHSILPDIQTFDLRPISHDNYNERVFLIESTLSKFISKIYFDFNKIIVENREILLLINRLLKQFIEQLANSEIIKNFKIIEFIYLYTEFMLTEKEESVNKMKILQEEYNFNETVYILILANSLQLIGKDKDAVEIINKQKKKCVESIYLEIHCYLKNDDRDNYIRVAKELLTEIKLIDIQTCIYILKIPFNLHAFEKTNDIEITCFTEGKTFEYGFLKILFDAFLKIIYKQELSNILNDLKSIEEEVLKTGPEIAFYIAYSYFILEKYSLAIEFFEKYVPKDKESIDLFYYILALDKSVSNHRELLTILERWRLEFSFNAELLVIEADLRRQLSDWEKCLTISEYFLSKENNNEPFLVLKLISINELNPDNKKEKFGELASIFDTYEFRFYGHALNVAKILIENGLQNIALDILYKKAIDPKNMQARNDYVQATIEMPLDLIQEKEIVEIGCFVKYSVKDEIKFIEIQKGNVLGDQLIGLKKGDTINIERPILKIIDSITILRIMDKYLCLHDEIFEEIRSNPYGGFSMQAFKFEDTSPEGLKASLISLFGADGSDLKASQDAAHKAYYNYILSYSELIIQNYSSDYLGSYFHLVHEKDGITQIPLNYYPIIEFKEKTQFVIDFSSLFILFQIYNEHKIEFNHKFIIGKWLVDLIRHNLKKEQSNPKEQMFLNITLEGINPTIKPEIASSSNILYLERLLGWIKSNCTETIVESKLDSTRQLEEEIKNKTFVEYILESISLTMESADRILITDDLIYLKILPLESGKIISSEFYVKSTRSQDDTCTIEFIKNRYIGFTISDSILFNEFEKMINEQPNLYSYCLKNVALQLIPGKQTIYTLIRFLKLVAISSKISNDIFKKEATNALINLLQGQRLLDIFILTELYINQEFEQMDAELKLMKESYSDALIVLRIDR